MSVVAVFEIHIDSAAAAIMKPNTTRRLLPLPTRCSNASAIRRCAPLRSMAVDRMNPPSSSNTTG